MRHNIIATTKAPAAIGPYSQGVKVGELIFTSGQLPVNMVTGELEAEIKAATKASIENCKSILEQAGSSLDKVVKTLVFLSDMDNFAAMNEIYAEYFTSAYPARSCVEVAKLPKGAVVEIEMVAVAE